MLRIVRQLLHPIAQLRRMHAQVLRRLHIRHASIFDQAHSLKLELSRKLSPLHDAPPVLSKHLTRCLRNRVQATTMFAGQALAQSATVEIEPAQRTKIKEYVVKEKVAPVRVKERISVGAKLPADVELRSVPSDWGPAVSKYRYVYSDNHVYFVDPANRTVVQEID